MGVRRYPSFKALQSDYPALAMIPAAWMAQPDFDPLARLWRNLQRGDAEQSLRAAWVTTLNERERRNKHTKTWRRIEPKTSEPVNVAPLPKHWPSWIERTIKED